MGASAVSSIDDPCTKVPPAMITLSWYPGKLLATGMARESTGDAFWIPWQKAFTPSGSLSLIACTISERWEPGAGDVSKPRVVNKWAAGKL
jgi:hypothetical protein